ncbi:methionine ABC transporter permease, partial [Sphingobacterium sp. IITKGP-BTPF85]|uniref:methionine ABC transporter permease n=1 Tax=Sphingobacterium sp. IITKGP-BTPF85 TaxID=1338009 RepID=UPI000389EB6D
MSDTVIDLLIKGTIETIVMTFLSGFFGFLIGLPTGIFLFLTRRNQLHENKYIHQLLAILVNIFRSIPFIILIVWMIPFTRQLVGTSIGVTAALVPLSFAAAPFIARLVENSLLEIPHGLIEAARAMGATNITDNIQSLLPESLPSLVNNLT